MSILQTQRLVLREFTLDDAAFILDLLNDPGWLRHIGDRGVRRIDEARAWIGDRLIAHYRRHGYGLWAMQQRANGELLGMCGLVRRESLPDADVGYALMPAARGQGYAAEAVRACLRHASEVLALPCVLAITSPDNLASQRVLQAAGMRFVEQRVLPGESRETRVYASQAASPQGGVVGPG